MEGDNMSKNTTPVYKGRQIDPNILSVLDVISEGKVVSVENWTTLWNLVLEHINTNTAFCISVDSLIQQWHASEEALAAVVDNFNKKYDSFSKSFIHYGETPPENEHIRIWVQPTEYIQTDVTLNKISTVTLKAADWKYIADKNIYSQTISLQNVTPYSKIDLNPSPEQLKAFSNKGYAFVVGNKNKVVTVYCVGQKPIHDYTMQVTVTEVSKVNE